MHRSRKQIQHQQEELKKREEEAFKCLPRSARWRIQLNLLTPVRLTTSSISSKRIGENDNLPKYDPLGGDPLSNHHLNVNSSYHSYQQFNDKDLDMSETETELSLGEDFLTFATFTDQTNNNNNNNSNHNNSVSSRKKKDSLGFSYLSKIERVNQDKITKQRSRYEKLSKKHYWSCSPLAIIQDVEKEVSNSTRDGRRMKKRGSFNVIETMFGSSSSLALSDDSTSSMIRSSASTPVNLSSLSTESPPTMERSKTTNHHKNKPSKMVPDHPLAEKQVVSEEEKKDRNKNESVTQNSKKDDTLIKPSKTDSSMVDDPLSAIAFLEERDMELKKNSELEYMRQKARMQRYAGHVKHRDKLFDKKDPIPAALAMSKGGAACAGSRWNDYYSSREVLSIIEKDLKRLPPDHHLCYHYMKQKQNEKNSLNETNDLPSPTPQHPLDEIPFPTTTPAETTEIHRNTKTTSQIETRGHRGMSSNNRHLNDGFGEIFDLMNTLSNDDDCVKRSREERSNKLSELLFVYAKEHPALGYRQGMHEILSLVYLCLELDFFLLEKQNQLRLDSHDNDLNQNSNSSLGFVESVSSNTSDDAIFSSNQKSLLDPNKLMHDAYSIFEAIMSQLSPGYDVASTQKSQPDRKSTNSHNNSNNNNKKFTKSNTCSMELMGKSILEKIMYVSADEDLYNTMTQMSVPPQLYCTRWVRLMFSREVVGWRNVMQLWDVFFQLISINNNNSKEQSNANNKQQLNQEYNINLMNVLESTAASMICLLRNKLIPPPKITQEGYPNPNAEDFDPNECIDILMNYPPLEDISPLVNTLVIMISQEQEFKLNSLKSRRGLRRVGTIVSESTQNLREVFRRGSNNSDVATHSGHAESVTESRNHSKKTNVPNQINVSHKQNSSTFQQDRYNPNGTNKIAPLNSERVNGRHQSSSSLGQNNRNYYDPNYREHQIMDSSNGLGNAMSKLSLSVRGAWGHIDSTFHNLINEPPSQNSSLIQNHTSSLPLQKAYNDPHVTVENIGQKTIGTSSDKKSPNSKNNFRNIDSNDKVVSKTEQLNFNDLAKRLESSVDVLLTHFNQSLQHSVESNHRASIPPNVWNALSDIQDVKMQLQKKSITSTKSQF